MKMLIEPLETRTLFAMTCTLKDGLLTVKGVNYGEFMTITSDPTKKIVNVADTTERVEIFNRNFKLSQVKKVKVLLNGGNDSITCFGLAKSISVTIDGGAGNDTIEGSYFGKSTLTGGAGKDDLSSGVGGTTFKTKGDGAIDTIEYRKGDVLQRDSKDVATKVK